jgi:hypothetical protein
VRIMVSSLVGSAAPTVDFRNARTPGLRLCP